MVDPKTVLSADPELIDPLISVRQITKGDPENGIPPILPISRWTLKRRANKGIYPKPIRHQGQLLWRYSDIKKLTEDIAAGKLP